MDDREADRPNTGATRRALGCRRVALGTIFGIAGSAWTAIALLVGSRSLPVFGILAIAALACFAAAYGLLAFRRWAAVVAVLAFVGSAGLAYVVYLAIRSAFATYPF